ncbi:hypothetical protein L1987_39815 [Smallanthus sonchifolius]|uniref:Uncharacterized protein n=1 Tax=Smallanthus sonchifolius TaxID=185202 RepID=A0ACB9GT63_9ASTR|nr:hypothetical protein L1987_39815 [Smallanthus sonchifolius]
MLPTTETLPILIRVRKHSSSPKQQNHSAIPPSNKSKSTPSYQKVPKTPAAIVPTHLVSSQNRFTALDSVMADCPDEPQCYSNEDQVKFYEFTEDTITNVLNFKPSSLSIPRVNDMNLDLGESLGQEIPSDDEVPNFDISNAQKKAISSSLEKYGAVKAGDQADWSQGEWEYFKYMLKSMQIYQSTCIEDVDSDTNGTARFLKKQMEQSLVGDHERSAPSNPLIV